MLDGASNWRWNYDPGTPGSAQGTSVYPEPGISSDNAARKFYMTYNDHGGEIYHLSFAIDAKATHFVYDTQIYLENPTQLGNIEMDMNQVMADGRTVIFGTQCSSYSKTWEYTVVKSTGNFGWLPSNLPCNPKTWTANTWHHVQIASHRDGNGNVTYDWIGLDGVYSQFSNATGPSARSLGWALGDLLLNFQLDGANVTNGSITADLDQLKIYRW